MKLIFPMLLVAVHVPFMVARVLLAVIRVLFTAHFLLLSIYFFVGLYSPSSGVFQIYYTEKESAWMLKNLKVSKKQLFPLSFALPWSAYIHGRVQVGNNTYS